MNLALPHDSIRIDGGTQMRAELSEATVAEYAERMADGEPFPPVVAFFDGSTYWLADGFHRYHASRKASKTHVECDVRKGTRRDAVLFAAGANWSHGLRRSNADKRKAVEALLADEEWRGWSDRAIALACGVSNDLVSRTRQALSFKDSDKSPNLSSASRKTADGRVMDTARIGRTPPPATPPAPPPAPARVYDTPEMERPPWEDDEEPDDAGDDDEPRERYVPTPIVRQFLAALDGMSRRDRVDALLYLLECEASRPDRLEGIEEIIARVAA